MALLKNSEKQRVDGVHKLNVSDKLNETLKKVSKKDTLLYERVLKKMKEIINSDDIEHYKNLRYDMKDSKRAHVGHFVLIFGFDKNIDEISFDDFDHHDRIYQS